MALSQLQDVFDLGSVYHKYFRSEPCTSLFVRTPFPITAEGDAVVEWVYQYRDFGMDWEVERKFFVRSLVNGFVVRDAREERWQRAACLAMVMDIVFDQGMYECERNAEDFMAES